MEYLQPILIILHIIGVAMGVGGAFTTDATFIRSIWNRSMTSSQLSLIEIISKVVITGLVLLILSGATLVYLNPHYFSLTDGNPVFWVKLTIVLILTLNGVAFHKLILPHLRKYQDENLANDETRAKLWLLALTGGLSGISWVSALILGVLMQVIELPYLFLLNIYLLLVTGAILSGYLMIYWILFSNLRKDAPEPEQTVHIDTVTLTQKTSVKHSKNTGWQKLNLFLLAVVTALLLVFGVFVVLSGQQIDMEHLLMIAGSYVAFIA